MSNTTRSVEALDETEFDRITARIEDNRDGRGRLLCGASRGISTGGCQHGYPSLHEFGGEHWQPAVIAATVDETTFAQPFMKCLKLPNRIFG